MNENKDIILKFLRKIYNPWRNSFKQDHPTIENRANAVSSFTGFLICLLLFGTNVFWVISYTIGSTKGQHPTWAVFFLAAIILASIIGAIGVWPKKKHIIPVRYFVLFIMLALCTEVCVIGSMKNTEFMMLLNELTDLTDEQMRSLMESSGIPLVSSYLICGGFLVFYKVRDAIYIDIMECAAILLQFFLPGHEVFSYKFNLIVLVTVIILSTIVRALALNFIRKDIDLRSERERYRKTVIETFEAMSEAIDLKDSYTGGHSNRVAEVSVEIGKRIGMEEIELRKLYFGGLIHDIGKISIPDAILNKPGKLTDEEYEIIKQHPVKGSEMVSKLSSFPSMDVPVRWHHERYDGRGYPDHLKGKQIPLEARIMAIADAFDAMNSTRSYRKNLSMEEIREQISKNAGTQFDPELAEIFLQLIDEGIVR